MPSHLPSPPSSRPSSPDGRPGNQPELVEAETLDCETQHPSKDQESPEQLLSERLDALLISYLTLLDTYTSLRAQLSKDLSGGFFALARANRNANSTLGVGRRYGEEGFDERMKAGKVLRIQEEGNRVLAKTCDQEELGEVGEHIIQRKGREMEEGKISTEKTASPLKVEDTEVLKNDSEKDVQQSATTPYCFSVSSLSASNIAIDPIKWYGILVPPTLRTCQTHFTTAISSTIPEIMSVMSAMRTLEEEIWDVRLRLGIVGDRETRCR